MRSKSKPKAYSNNQHINWAAEADLCRPSKEKMKHGSLKGRHPVYMPEIRAEIWITDPDKEVEIRQRYSDRNRTQLKGAVLEKSLKRKGND